MTILNFITKILVISPVVFLLSCGPNDKAGDDEGLIEFATNPIDEKHPLFGLAPSTATLKYKKRKICARNEFNGYVSHFNYWGY
ncbi:MAG: hypothetical protein H0W73_14585 [Bacteroidetes bacterium]|nr:hypothetical protein [Bacteroidota bacterium]